MFTQLLLTSAELELNLLTVDLEYINNEFGIILLLVYYTCSLVG